MKRRTTLTSILVVLVLLLPYNVAVSQELPPGPTPVYRSSFEVTNPPAHFDTINLVLDFAPGAWTPMHTHGGQGIVTVLEGELTHRPHGGEEQTFVAGESFTETPGHVHAAGNDTDATARVLFTILLPKGAELTTVVQNTGQPTLPETGVFDSTSRELWFLVMSAGALITISGWFIQRKARRS
jgi:quercetin dioxygenase-like cupin family protein